MDAGNFVRSGNANVWLNSSEFVKTGLRKIANFLNFSENR